MKNIKKLVRNHLSKISNFIKKKITIYKMPVALKETFKKFIFLTLIVASYPNIMKLFKEKAQQNYTSYN